MRRRPDVQIGVFVKRLAVLLEQLNAYLRPDQTVLHLLLNDLLHPALQVIRKILNEGQDFLHGSSLDDLLHEKPIRLVIVCIDMNFGNASEEVMDVTKDVLIGPHQKKTYGVGLSLVESMELQRALHAKRRHKPIHL